MIEFRFGFFSIIFHVKFAFVEYLLFSKEVFCKIKIINWDERWHKVIIWLLPEMNVWWTWNMDEKIFLLLMLIRFPCLHYSIPNFQRNIKILYAVHFAINWKKKRRKNIIFFIKWQQQKNKSNYVLSVGSPFQRSTFKMRHQLCGLNNFFKFDIQTYLWYQVKLPQFYIIIFSFIFIRIFKFFILNFLLFFFSFIFLLLLFSAFDNRLFDWIECFDSILFWYVSGWNPNLWSFSGMIWDGQFLIHKIKFQLSIKWILYVEKTLDYIKKKFEKKIVK